MGIRAFVYYQVGDAAFERAAKTRAGVTTSSGTEMFLPVKTKDDFVSAWKQVEENAESLSTVVDLVCLYPHASKDDGSEDGFEFAPLSGQSGTLNRDEMSLLARLPWADSGTVRLELNGCNTGLRESRGWCPAEHLAQTQIVPCRGEIGYSYFSKSLDQYTQQDAGDPEIYLHAFKRGKNAPLGDGGKMPARAFDPYTRKDVGVGCPNVVADVLAVQQLLNDVPSNVGGPDPKLVEDGLFGLKTTAAIKKFQNNQMGFEDGVVSPGKRTLIKLLEFKSF